MSGVAVVQQREQLTHGFYLGLHGQRKTNITMRGDILKLEEMGSRCEYFPIV